MRYFLLCLFTTAILCADSQQLELASIREAKKNQDIHGLIDVSIKNDYITPRGLLVTNTGVTFQVLGITFFDVYKNPDGFINKTTLFAGVWNDIWTDQGNPYVGAWNECDWLAGFTAVFNKRWTFGVQFLGFISPPHNFKVEDNLEFLLSYDDSNPDCPFAFNPYMKWFWAMAGSSTIVTGKPGGTFDVEIGMLPSYSFESFKFIVPTWITVAPQDFFNGGTPAFKHDHCNFGVFSTGLRIEIPLKFIPERLGNWMAYINGQYYYLINDNLLLAQTVTLGIPYKRTHRDVGLACAGLNFSF